MLSELAGWVALALIVITIPRVWILKRGPNLTTPLEEEIETLQRRQMQDRLNIAKLELDNQNLNKRLSEQANQMHEMKKDITLLRRQIKNLGYVPAFGEKFETGPLE